MGHFAGILFAIIALLSWGLGDFFIQKTTRKVGDWKSLFYIGLVGFVVLFPFVKDQILFLKPLNLLLLCLLEVAVLFSSLFDFEALKEGKIAVIEPVMALELPMTIGLSLFFLGERLSLLQALLILFIFISLILVVTARQIDFKNKRQFLERGVFLAGLGAIGMALTNFLMGLSSIDISPLMAVWFSFSLLALISFLAVYLRGEAKTLWTDFKKYPGSIVGESIFDTTAWVAYGFATTLIPVSIAITIGESYIALAVLLGVFVNHEKLKQHQYLGIVCVTLGVIVLSYFSS